MYLSLSLKKLTPNPVKKKNYQYWKMHKNVIPPCLHALWFLHVLTRLANPRSFRSLFQINLSGLFLSVCSFANYK